LPFLYLAAFLLPTIKVSTVFVALLPVFASLYNKLHLEFKHWVFVISAGLFCVVPFFARNLILSGYLIFPLPLDLFNFDWQYFDTARLSMMNRYIINAARITGPHDPGLWTYDMSITEWFPHWLSWRSPHYYFMNFVLPICLVFSLFSMSIVLIKRRWTDYFYVCFSAFFLISFFYWLFSAPDFRFIWGTMISGVSICSYYVVERMGLASDRLKISISVALILALAILAYKTVDRAVLLEQIKLPQKIKEIIVLPQQVGPIVVNKPDSKKLGGLCYNAQIPCTHHVHDTFEARGTKIRDGFRANPSLKKKKKKKKKKKVITKSEKTKKSKK